MRVLGCCFVALAACTDTALMIADAGEPPAEDAGARCEGELVRIGRGLPYLSAGYTGGPLDGRLSVFVIDADTGGPLDGANVIVQTSELELRGVTQCGRAELVHESLRGTVAVHAMTPGFWYRSFYGVPSSIVSFATAHKVEPQSVRDQFATVRGHVRGLETITGTTASAVAYGVINPLVDPLFGALNQEFRLGAAGTSTNQVLLSSPPARWTDYALTISPATTTGMFVTAGLFSNSFTAQRYGLLVGGIPNAGETAHGRDLVLDLEAGDPLIVELGERPPEVQNVAVWAAVRIGGHEAAIEGLGSPTARLPRLTGPLANATYSITVAGLSPAEFLLQSLVFSRGLTEPRVVIERLPELPRNISVSGRTISAETPAGVRIFTVFISQNSVPAYDRQTSAWLINVRGDGVSITLPEPPEGMEDPLSGRRAISVSAIDADIDPDALDFDASHATAVVRTLARKNAVFDL